MHNAAVWLDNVKRAYGEDLELIWRNFSLEQVNSGEDADWKAWEQSDLDARRSMVAAIAAGAAQRQGEELFSKFHLALLKARHGGKGRIALNDEGAMVDLAGEVGLDVEQLRKDMGDPDLQAVIGRDHEEAVGKHGAFGTPTFVFENGNTAYLKTFVPPEGDSVEFFEHFLAIMAHSPFVGELKRPQPPWPKGVN